MKKGISDRYAIHENKKVTHFISLYIDSEFLAQRIVSYKRGYENKNDFLALNYQELAKSLKLFKFSVSAALIKEIFKSGNGLRNQKTPRQLRNGLMHEKSIRDIVEIEARYDELIGYMNQWVKAIRKYMTDR